MALLKKADRESDRGKRTPRQIVPIQKERLNGEMLLLKYGVWNILVWFDGFTKNMRDLHLFILVICYLWLLD